jgi:two-component system chemotaxis response regulator CheB
MPGHDIIVIGTSAGGVEALRQLARELPADLRAAVFVVIHLPAQAPSLLPDILSRDGALPAAHAVNGEPIRRGRIYVAPPDNHLLVERDHMRVVHGPRENRYRPAVDPLFRSAAVAYGPRVVGVVLTGALDDGTVGMKAVKECGGVAIVQDPAEAIYPSMPRSVLRAMKVDYCVRLAEIAPLLARLSGEAAEEGAHTVPDDLKTENEIAEQQMEPSEMLESVQKLGALSAFTCPECQGSLWEIRDGELLRFRCHTGHAFSSDSLLAEQNETLEGALWSAVRALEEKMALARRMAARARDRNFQRAARSFDLTALDAERQADAVRRLLLSGRDELKAEGNGFAEQEEVETA